METTVSREVKRVVKEALGECLDKVEAKHRREYEAFFVVDFHVATTLPLDNYDLEKIVEGLKKVFKKNFGHIAITWCSKRRLIYHYIIKVFFNY